MLAWNDLVTVVNRTSRPVDIRADGATITLAPHEERQLPRFVAELGCRQNPVMGTEDPLNPADFQMLIGVREWNHDCSPIEQSDKIERLDRRLFTDPLAQKATVEPVRHPVQREQRALSEDAIFTANR